MRLLALLVALSIILAACTGIGDDDDPTVEPPEATATTESATQPPPDPDPTATEEEAAEEPSPTIEATATEETEEASPTAGETDTTPTAAAEGDDAELEALIQEIAEETSNVRALPLQEEIDSEILSREDLRADLTEMIEEEYGQEDADLDRDLLWMLRLIPDRGLDYLELQISLLTEQVAGYYDSDTGELVVIGEEAALNADQKVTMSHEITHALQDQHFGLGRYEDDDTDFERVTAFQALTEGDATWTMVQWAIANLSMEEISEFLEAGEEFDSPTFDSAPRYIRESLTFPYNAGFQFVEALIEEGGLEAVNAAFDDPPTTTEQILNPELYIGEPRNEPLEVSLPDLSGPLGEGWENVYEGTLGVFDLNILLEENGVSNGSQATQEWGGTRFVMYESEDDLLTVLSTLWETEEAATRFNEALRQTMAEYEQDGDIWFDGERYHAIISGGDRVILTTSTNPDALRAALDAQQVNTP